MEKKDEEVGLDSRLLKKDSNRFIEPLMCATGCKRERQCAVRRPQPRFRAQHYRMRTQRHSFLKKVGNFIFVCPFMPETFTPTPEQLALREARRLKKEKATTNAGASSSTPPSSLVNNEKGQILPRPWLAVQDSLPNAAHTARIMTWNVRSSFYSCVLVHSVG